MAPMPSSEDFFWRAIEIGVYGRFDEDIADLGRYVASRGATAAAEFGGELGKAVTALRDAGVCDVLLARHATTTDGRAFADLPESEKDHCLEKLILFGRRDFDKCLANPERVGAGPWAIPLVDLRGAVESARAESGIESGPLWQEEAGDRRRDGKLWLELDVVLVGLDWNSDPWTIPGVLERFEKAALLRSLDDSWRAWRSSIGARTVTVTLEYSAPGHQEERVAVEKLDASTEVTVCRDFSRLSVPGDALHLAELEAETVLDEVRAAYTSSEGAVITPSLLAEDETTVDEAWGLPSPAPAFAAHFTDPLYEDDGDEDAPFGSDEGSDMLANWAARRDELGPTSTVADVLEGDPAEYLARNDFDSAEAVHVAGFTLLRLTGQIDPAGRAAVLEALTQLQSGGWPMDPDEDPYEKQRRDLMSFEE